MKNFALVANYEKENIEEAIIHVKKVFEAVGGIVTVIGKDVSKNHHFSRQNDIPEGTECIVALGGDGTLIQACDDLSDLGVPFIGVNFGTLGYLSEVTEETLSEAIQALVEDRYYLDSRMMLSGSVIRDGEVLYENVGLNDIVLHSEGLSRCVNFTLSVDGKDLNSYLADGMILSTPTGSTAYNLSAGGPLVSPDAEVILATPINPHTLLSRSIVLPPEVTIEMKLQGKKDLQAVLNFDSSRFGELQCGDVIRVRKAPSKTTLIKLDRNSFIGVLRKKLVR